MINLEEYEIIKPDYVQIKNIEPEEYIDISIEDDNTFFISQNNGKLILTHNCDGAHIASLILNFIYKWFPYMIEEGRLYQLVTPLITAYKGKTYLSFNSLKEYNEYLEKNGKGLTNVRYLKGLGSLSIADWDHIFKDIDKYLVKFEMDERSEEFINLAFGDSAEKRKVWLTT